MAVKSVSLALAAQVPIPSRKGCLLPDCNETSRPARVVGNATLQTKHPIRYLSAKETRFVVVEIGTPCILRVRQGIDLKLSSTVF